MTHGLTVTFMGLDPEGWPWTTDDPEDACSLIAPGEPVFVHVRQRERVIADIWRPQPACPTTPAALTGIVEKALQTLHRAN